MRGSRYLSEDSDYRLKPIEKYARIHRRHTKNSRAEPDVFQVEHSSISPKRTRVSDRKARVDDGSDSVGDDDSVSSASSPHENGSLVVTSRYHHRTEVESDRQVKQELVRRSSRPDRRTPTRS
jgi:hypothetical protein